MAIVFAFIKKCLGGHSCPIIGPIMYPTRTQARRARQSRSSIIVLSRLLEIILTMPVADYGLFKLL